MKELKYLNKYLYKYKWQLLLGILFVALSNVFKVLSPRILSWAIDMVSQNITLYASFENFELQETLKSSLKSSLLVFSLIYFAAALIGGVFTFLMRQSIIVMSRLVEFDLKNEIYKHYQRLDTSFYKRNNTGDLMNRATEDVSKVRMYMGPALMYLINVFFLFTFVIYTMLSINVSLTLWVLLPMPFLTVSIFYVNNLIHKRSEAIQQQLSVLTSNAQEYYSGIRVLKSYVQEKLALKFYEDASENYKEKALSLAHVQAFFFPLMVLLVGLSTIIVVIVGGQYIQKGLITPGNIVEFIMYVNLLTWPVTSIGWTASLIQSAAASQKRINEFLKTDTKIDTTVGAEIELKGKLSFKGLSFTYPDTGIEALKNLNFEIKAGEKWAVMGRTGCGKTTLAELILGMYYPSSGELLIEGHNIEDVKLSRLRQQIGYIPQDVFLFSDTIYNNIRFGNSELTDEEAESAAQKASIYEEIMEFPEGFSTLVGERGVTLSGGQKQRISIARALAMQPRLLVFDDALSAVDVHTEKMIIQNLNESIVDKTVIVISHRIFSSLEFDQIVILEDGGIAEQGTHKELLAKGGIYAEFYDKQNFEQVQ
ncbi:MAG: ATP-binding cassette subfamily B multidrug efflux pump [Chitinophagales bacterium]